MSEEYTQPKKIPFQEVLNALLDGDTPLNPRYLYRLTDLDRVERAQLKSIWGDLPTWRRKAMLEDLEQIFEGNTLLSFEAICRMALRDEEAEVRFVATRSLLEYEVPDLIDTFIQMMKKDPDVEVRAIAASALGKYIFLGEIGELPESQLERIGDHLLTQLTSQDEPLVRRRALEALGFSSRPEVMTQIKQAFSSRETVWICSALFAMGRSYDERWHAAVLDMLDHLLPVIRFEAARAAGELEIQQATNRLIELTGDDDEEVRSAAIWSLSQIGGKSAQRALKQLLAASQDEEESEFIETALDSLIFNESVEIHELLDLSEGDDLDDEAYDDDYDDDDDFEFDDDLDDDYEYIDFDRLDDEDELD